ncbi:MAG: hypothetical protein JNL06_05300 [Alphaproteobacteria bacterium]|nr:hypothetical protein [Alphaproteobacteria bacterium]
MRHRFAATAIAAALALTTSAVANADDRYFNEGKQFEVTVPTGWKQIAGDGGMIDLVLSSPRFEATMGLCVLISRDIADTRKDSQAKIDEEAGAAINDAFWREVMTDKNTTVTSVQSKSEMRGGRRVYFGTVGVTSLIDGKSVNLQIEMVLHVMPGKGMMGQCGVEVAQLDAEKIDIQTIINSYNSTGSGVVASADPHHNHGSAAKLSNTLTEALTAGAKDMIGRMAHPQKP